MHTWHCCDSDTSMVDMKWRRPCTRTSALEHLQPLGTQATDADWVAVMPRLRQQHDVECVIVTDVHDLVDLVVGWLDVERAEHETLDDKRCVTEYTDGHQCVHVDTIELDPGSSQLAATDNHGNMSGDSSTLPTCWSLGFLSIVWPEISSISNNVSYSTMYKRKKVNHALQEIVGQGYSNGGPRSTIRTAKTLLADRDWLLWKWKIRP